MGQPTRATRPRPWCTPVTHLELGERVRRLNLDLGSRARHRLRNALHGRTAPARFHPYTESDAKDVANCHRPAGRGRFRMLHARARRRRHPLGLEGLMSCPPLFATKQDSLPGKFEVRTSDFCSCDSALSPPQQACCVAAMADFIYDDLEPANIAAAQVLIAAGRPHMPFLVSPAPNTCERTPPAAERAGRKRHVFVCMCVCVCVYVCCGGSIASSSNLSAPALTPACCLAVRASCWERFCWWC